MKVATKKYVAKAVISQLKTEHNYLPDAFRMTWERTIEYQVRSLVQVVNGDRSKWVGVYVR